MFRKREHEYLKVAYIARIDTICNWEIECREPGTLSVMEAFGRICSVLWLVRGLNRRRTKAEKHWICWYLREVSVEWLKAKFKYNKNSLFLTRLIESYSIENCFFFPFVVLPYIVKILTWNLYISIYCHLLRKIVLFIFYFWKIERVVLYFLKKICSVVISALNVIKRSDPEMKIFPCPSEDLHWLKQWVGLVNCIYSQIWIRLFQSSDPSHSVALTLVAGFASGEV